MLQQTIGSVVKNEQIKSLYFLLEIDCPTLANPIKPGQFIMLKVSDNNAPLLRRPFSVYKISQIQSPSKKRGRHLSILYKKVGKGTQKMTEFKQGQKVDMIGPLGNGFTLPPLLSSSNIILIGGGVGIVSLSLLAELLKTRKLFIFIGGRTKHDILCIEDFRKLNAKIFIATEDGSFGFQGTVVDLFLTQMEKIRKNEINYLYSCGPNTMLKKLAETIPLNKFISQASFETRMGCGFGACWGCVIKTKDPQTPYRRVCKEGPVFNLEDIVWKE